MEDNKNFIGTNIKNILNSREIEVKDFATKLNLTVEQVEKWFSCDDEIPIHLLPNISSILNVSYERLFNKPKKYSCIDESDFTELDFKKLLDINLTEDIHIYRGQKNDFWPLMSSFCRYCFANRVKEERNLVKCKYCPANKLVNINTINTIRKECSVLDNSGLFKEMNAISLLSYLQHNGVPTPLLDWTYSPYIALFFAIKDSDSSENAVLYDFNLSKYQKDFPEDFVQNGVVRVGDKPITIIQADSENVNQLNQQGLFMFCSKTPNILDYFQELYDSDNTKKYFSKKIFSLNEFSKKEIMESFKRMNITERTLFPDSIHVAKDIINNIFIEHLKIIIETIMNAKKNRKS